jgi:endonuclease/exonuclease/phosphatase family metal-dependent hydrolase
VRGAGSGPDARCNRPPLDRQRARPLDARPSGNSARLRRQTASVRVLTLNLWNISEPLEARLAALVAGLDRLAPDVVCLQEVSPHPQLSRPQSELVAQMCHFPHHVFSGSGYWGEREEGLAILSRYPIVGSVRTVLPKFQGDTVRQVFVAELDAESRLILVANTHLAFPLHMRRERVAQVAVLMAALKDCRERFGARSLVLCGDFNDMPDSPAIRTLLDSDPVLVDAFASLHPQDHGHTFSSKNPYVRVAPGEEGRIDYIFASGELVLDACDIVFDGGNGLQIASDHFGLLATLRFA